MDIFLFPNENMIYILLFSFLPWIYMFINFFKKYVCLGYKEILSFTTTSGIKAKAFQKQLRKN